MPSKKRSPKVVPSGDTTPRKRRKIVLKQAARPAGLLVIDDVLLRVNLIQMKREPSKFKVALEDFPVVSNILRDAGLVFSFTEMPTHVAYSVEPGAPVAEGENALENLEDYSDEIPEDGQLFD
jgi:hypothetical protein